MKNNILDTSESDPIFIVGMNGSGTTLLLDLLNNHPNIYGFNFETKILPYYISYTKKRSKLNNEKLHIELYEKISQEYVFKCANNGSAVPLPNDKDEIPRSLSEIINRIFMYFTLKEKKVRWCEKTPAHAIHMQELGKIFPNAKFIHLIRDGRSCAASMHRRWKHSPNIAIYRWKHMIKEAQKQSKYINSNNYMEIRYENLTSDPEKWMRHICRFIGEPFDNSVLYCERNRTFTGSSAKTIVNKAPKWVNYFNEHQKIQLEKIAGEMLARLGYSSNHINSDDDPSYLYVKYCYYKGHISQFVNAAIINLKNGKFKQKTIKKLPFMLTRLKARIKNNNKKHLI